MQHPNDTRTELDRYIRTGKIPNALLFSGKNRTGRKEAAFWFAKQSNCLDMDNPGCGRCRSCKKIDNGSHPDILIIDRLEDKKNISISQIRQMSHTIASRPNEARHRMVLILNADEMNTQAQNALLKVLEEPPEKTFFILISQTTAPLLATIISRCRLIRFVPKSENQIARFLASTFNISPTLAETAAHTSGGDLEKAKMYLEIEQDPLLVRWKEKRKWLIRQIIDILCSNPASATEKGLVLSWYLSRNPDNIPDALSIIRTCFRDLLICSHHPKKIVNLDFFDEFKDISAKLPCHFISKCMEILFSTERKLASNCTVRLTLDTFFLRVVQENQGIYLI